jgi:hypothetical protein
MVIFNEGVKDSMVKLSSLSEDRKRHLRTAAAGVGAAGLAAGLLALSRSGIRADVFSSLKGIGRGGAVAVERSSKIPVSASRQADAVAAALKAKGIDPQTARIAISGTGGTGKSTLARGLSDRLGMEVRFLDDHGSSMTGRDYVSYLKKNPIGKGTIAEQTHLLTQVDPNKFDVIIRVHKPMDKVKKQIMSRGRGAYQLDLYDYDKLNKTIATAFDSASGTAFSPVSGVDIKFKPKSGFTSNESLKKVLRQRGVSVPASSTREQLVHMVASGDRFLASGVIPYLRKDNLAKGVGFSAAAGVVGAGGAHVIQGRGASR